MVLWGGGSGIRRQERDRHFELDFDTSQPGSSAISAQTTSALGSVHSVVSPRSILCRPTVASPHHGDRAEYLLTVMLLRADQYLVGQYLVVWFLALYSGRVVAAPTWCRLAPLGCFSQRNSAGVYAPLSKVSSLGVMHFIVCFLAVELRWWGLCSHLAAAANRIWPFFTMVSG